ncbi:hypothetical protein LR48_Vigan04g171000 [Vigna angularis]|uniref:Uncharacterized protein n=1 Tax=Phaseolus angularis TaxID=3914 RepID=A0A0L9UG40_PHAAN|nr:hypothetical protein LR48_Vigan04g171000 [Vigna angularis]
MQEKKKSTSITLHPWVPLSAGSIIEETMGSLRDCLSRRAACSAFLPAVTALFFTVQPASWFHRDSLPSIPACSSPSSTSLHAYLLKERSCEHAAPFFLLQPLFTLAGWKLLLYGSCFYLLDVLPAVYRANLGWQLMRVPVTTSPGCTNTEATHNSYSPDGQSSVEHYLERMLNCVDV